MKKKFKVSEYHLGLELITQRRKNQVENEKLEQVRGKHLQRHLMFQDLETIILVARSKVQNMELHLRETLFLPKSQFLVQGVTTHQSIKQGSDNQATLQGLVPEMKNRKPYLFLDLVCISPKRRKRDQLGKLELRAEFKVLRS